MGYQEHKRQAPRSIACGVLTVSDTRTEATDTSGRTIREMLTEAGHTVAACAIVPDEPAVVADRIQELVGGACQAILVNGGTGVSPRDRTYEAVCALFDQRLDGFGELFRMLSYQEIGASAMLSRAVAGIVGGKPVFCMPGSTNAVRLAMTQLILPELGHLVHELSK